MTDNKALSTVTYYYRVDRREISFIRFVLEACEGLAIMTTIDPGRGEVVFFVAPGCENDFEEILAGLKKDIMMEAMETGNICKESGRDDI